ncbi:hypothetical protein DFH28DRAFT_1083883 [Melampsora americana]|nr:hypothetical protein DFH28DRAFT_1083883 [Melampsora americana]
MIREGFVNLVHQNPDVGRTLLLDLITGVQENSVIAAEISGSKSIPSERAIKRSDDDQSNLALGEKARFLNRHPEESNDLDIKNEKDPHHMKDPLIVRKTRDIEKKRNVSTNTIVTQDSQDSEMIDPPRSSISELLYSRWLDGLKKSLGT